MMYNYNYTEDYLMHYGVKGMKWGHRRVRGHGGPGVYLNRKRQLAGDKRDLKTLEKGGHLSVGATKKRQTVLDARDKAALEKRIAKNEKVIADKEAAKAAKNTPEAIAKRKEALKIGTAVAGTALASYGVYKVSQAIKDKNFKHQMNQGMKSLDALASRGRFDDGMEQLKDIMDTHYNAKVSDIAKRTIANNSVNGKVDWKAIRKIYK